MGKNLKRALFSAWLLASALILGGLAAPAMAQDIKISDLGIESTGILPSNPFYFFKSFRRSLRDTFSWSDLSKAQSQLNTLNEQAAEIKQLNDINPDEFSGFSRAVKNYRETAVNLRGP